jgi:FtsZ-binding cell division protein ZapB
MIQALQVEVGELKEKVTRMQEWQDEVGELKEKVTRMQAHIEQLEVWRVDQERHREWVDQPWHREWVDEEQPWHREWTAWAGRGEWER